MNFVFSFILLVFIKQRILVYAASDQCPKLINSRLSRNVIPSHYDLKLQFNLNTLEFIGNVIITTDVKCKTNEITLHAKKLEIISAKFVGSTGGILGNATFCKEEETVTVHFSQIIKGKGKLYIEYNGVVPSDKVYGIYAVRNRTNTKTRYTIVSMFEPTGARTAYPCFDEPNMKSTFSITVIAPSDRTVLSNMPVIKKVSISETESKVAFAVTPKMSTYLTCVIIGDYDFVKRQSIDGRVEVKVYTPIGRSSDGLFALNVAIQALDMLQNYLGIKYPLPKLDLVSVGDFESHALENWGIIVSIERSLLVDFHGSILQKQTVAFIVNHEVSHQWFGNLVTLDWWTHTWLNEGFANYFENSLTSQQFKHWDYWSTYISGLYADGLDRDSLESSHPIKLHSVELGDIMDTAFDIISYNKASAVLRMIKQWIGEEAFRKSLNRYLTKNIYGNTKTCDVLNVLDSEGGKCVKKFMKPWFTRKGYPFLTVLENSTCSHSMVEQRVFKSYNDYTDFYLKHWNIPIIYSTSNQINKSTLITKRIKTVCNKCVTDWNVRLYGFYRTKYTRKEYKNLFEEVNNGNLDPRQRFSLQNDFFAFVKGNYASIVDYLNYVKKYKNEDQLFIWQSIIKSLLEINATVVDGYCSERMNVYSRHLLSTIYQKLKTSDSNDDLATLLRVLIYKHLGYFGDKSILKDANERFVDYYNGYKELDSNIRSAVFELIARTASDVTYNKLFDLFYRNRNDAVIRYELLNAMGLSSRSNQLKKALDFSLTRNVSISEMIAVAISASKSNPYIVWDFFKDHMSIYVKRAEGTAILGKLITGIVSLFHTEDKANEIEEYFAANNNKGFRSSLRISLEILRNNAKWYKRDAPVLCDYLKKQ